MNNILVRNLPRDLTEAELFEMFRPFGKVKKVSLVLDSQTGRSKGFGFVNMPEDSEALAAIEALNGRLVGEEKIRVKTTNQQSSPFQVAPHKPRKEGFRGGEAKAPGRGKNDGSRGPRQQRPHRREG
ncbi:MAG: RNA-binding protein [Nitrospirales bacterium]|nr:RNA-binding protein [Nitrospirales bacterium]